MVMTITQDERGNWTISGEGHYITYLGYTKEEAREHFRHAFGLYYEHITWIE